MPNTPKNQWPYPNEHDDPFFDQFEGLLNAQDSTAYAQKENTETLLMGGGLVSWNASTGVLSWSATIEMAASMAGFLWQLPAGNATIPDGSVLYVALTHAPVTNVTLTPLVANHLPLGDAYFMVAVRRGSNVHFRNNTVINNGDSVSLFDQRPGAPSGTVVIPVSVAGATTADWSLGDTFSYTMTENVAISFTNMSSGQAIAIAVTNPSTYTVTWPSGRWAGGTQPVQTTGGKTDVWTFINVGGQLYGSVVANMS